MCQNIKLSNVIILLTINIISTYFNGDNQVIKRNIILTYRFLNVDILKENLDTS